MCALFYENRSGIKKSVINFVYLFCPNTGTKFREPYHFNHVIPHRVKVSSYIREIEDIHFFEVNTKYISSNVLKISVISRVRSMSEIAYQQFQHEMKYFGYLPKKKVNFLFIFFR